MKTKITAQFRAPRRLPFEDTINYLTRNAPKEFRDPVQTLHQCSPGLIRDSRPNVRAVCWFSSLLRLTRFRPKKKRQCSSALRGFLPGWPAFQLKYQFFQCAIGWFQFFFLRTKMGTGVEGKNFWQKKMQIRLMLFVGTALIKETKASLRCSVLILM